MRPLTFLILCMSILFCDAACSQTLPQPITAHYKGYVLGPGDKLKLALFGEKDFDTTLTIDVAGNIAVPLLGNVRAAGLTISELDKKIENALVARDYFLSPIVTIALSEARPFWINGDVAKPGAYPFEANLNVRRATVAAGGYASTPKMSLIIGVKATLTSTIRPLVTIYREIDGEKEIINATEETRVLPGDVVYILYSLVWLTKR